MRARYSARSGSVARTAGALASIFLILAPAIAWAALIEAEATPTVPEPAVQILLRRPGAQSRQMASSSTDAGRVTPPDASAPRRSIEVPDRWRVLEQMLGSGEHPLDPYSPNTLKGDRPFARDWFVNVAVVPVTVVELRNIPEPAANTENDALGDTHSQTVVQQLSTSIALIEGDTTFRPPDWQIEFAPAASLSADWAAERGLLNVDPSRDPHRRIDWFVGVNEGYVEKHLRDVSVRYDFDSVRVGVQPFNTDFRGFLFQDDAVGIRFFGTRDNNTLQYNLAWFRRIEKDTNSGLNDLGQPLRNDDVLVANVYLQDLIGPGHTTQFTVLYNRNREEQAYYDRNGFLVRPAELGDGKPHQYDVVYLGWNGDGHFGRLNLTHSVYAALGGSSHDPIQGKPQQILAGFAAAEPSVDFDWYRIRGSLLAASGDRDPYGGRETGFDAVIENPQLAGSDTSFWIRQSIPFIGGGGVALSAQNGVLPNLRSSELAGQSNFVNPGLLLAGLGADLNLLPELRLLANVSYLRFAYTEVLEALRNQTISPDLGTDLSCGAQYRPLMTQNIVFTASLATLVPGEGYRQMFTTRPPVPYSLLSSLVLRY